MECRKTNRSLAGRKSLLVIDGPARARGPVEDSGRDQIPASRKAWQKLRGTALVLFSCWICLSLPASTVRAEAGAGALLKSSDRVGVLLEVEDPVARLAAEHLAGYLRAVTGTAPAITRVEGVQNWDWKFVLSQDPIPLFRDDGFALETSPSEGTVSIRSPQPAGLKYGVQKLILRLEQRGQDLWVPEFSSRQNPWAGGRELFIAEIEWHPTESEKKVLTKLQEKFSWLNWQPERLHRYIEMVESMGYNAVMLSDSDQMRWYAGETTELEEGLRKVRSMFEYARERGLGTSFFIWGQRGLEGLVENPRDPDQYADMVRYWELMIDRYGPLADKWILHWADPGGCKLPGCTVNTTQVASNRFFEILRQKGFQSDVFFSLWGLRWGGWPGYDGFRSVVGAGILDPEIGISLMRTYRGDIAHAAAAQYRKVGVWGWYSNDMETSPGLHVQSQILQNEFHRIHESADRLLDWYSLEDNNHILNLASLYVGGQLLWDRRGSGAEKLREFCRAVWGPVVGEPVFRALSAIETVRSGPGVNMIRRDLWPHGYLSWLGRGTAYPDRDLEECNSALQGVDQLAVDETYVPKLPLIVEPADLLEQIRQHLRYVQHYASIRAGYFHALEAAYRGRPDETRELMAQLDELPDYVEGSYGALEYAPYLRLKTFIDSWKGRSFSDNLALQKRVTASSWFESNPRFAPGQAVNGLLCEYHEEGWVAGASGPAWLKIDLGKVENIRSVRIYNRGYERENWDNNLIATPASVQVLYAAEDWNSSSGSIDLEEEGYSLLGTIEDWEPSSNPADFREVVSDENVQARFVKVIISGAANGAPAGTGEIEVR